MADAKRDANRVPTLIGVSATDGTTPLNAEITAATGRLRVDAVVTTPSTYTEGDTDATIEGNAIMFEGGGDTIRAVSDVYPLPVDCTEVEDVDDDSIAKAQVLPLKINENYLFSKTDDAWIRMQGSTDGYQFVSVIGLYDSTGHQADINTSGQLETAPYGEYDRYKQDASTEAITTIDYSHHEVHDGSHFFVYLNKDVANGGTYNLTWTAPNTTKWIHMTIGVNVEGEADVKFYEDVESFTDGTSVTPYNSNRNSGASTITDMVYDATLTLGSAVTLANHVIGSGRSVGGGTRSDNEFVLKQGSIYSIVVTNQVSGSPNETNFSLNWYEHTDAN